MKHRQRLRPQVTNAECIRCGTCCEKGGPGFHENDRDLIDNGIIPSRCLFTIRKGEFAYDNVKGSLKPLDSDIIKIKGKGNTWTCIFFDEAGKQCSIYDNRPRECRALKCWDTRELERIYAKRRLTREDLVADVEGLWDLIADHQERCDYDKIRDAIRELELNDNDTTRRQLAEIIKFDIEIRNLVVTRGGLDEEMLDFLFGRPLTKTLPNYGIEVQRQGEKIILVPKVKRTLKSELGMRNSENWAGLSEED
ncbi:MAG: YkgJ family cysteine cluster protein [Desulfobacterales bacterium]|nr:YkgJ family cysteine cluster protein [Desulfobacterales bacterium]